MAPQCVVPNCTNKGGHLFPKDVRRGKQWLHAIRREHFKPSKHSIVCYAHFDTKDYIQQTVYVSWSTAAPPIVIVTRNSIPLSNDNTVTRDVDLISVLPGDGGTRTDGRFNAACGWPRNGTPRNPTREELLCLHPQFKFWDAVETLQPQAIINVLQLHPYHIHSLLQLSEVCKMGEDVQTATDLIERALFVFENAFHSMFSLTHGNCRLTFSRPENRAFYLALFRHLICIGNRGCCRTALEICKLLVSLDPEGDPLCASLLIDFYALRTEEYQFIINMSHEWEASD